MRWCKIQRNQESEYRALGLSTKDLESKTKEGPKRPTIQAETVEKTKDLAAKGQEGDSTDTKEKGGEADVHGSTEHYPIEEYPRRRKHPGFPSTVELSTQGDPDVRVTGEDLLQINHPTNRLRVKEHPAGVCRRRQAPDM
jgi:hypothetical protein